MIKIIILTLLLITTLASAQNLQVVTEVSPPLQIRNSNNEATGAMVDIVEMMLKKSNLTADIKIYPWARSYQLALNEKNTLIFSLLRDQAREEKFQWIGKLYSLEVYIATLKTREDIKIDSITAAKSYRVGTIRGDLAETYLLDNGFSMNENLFISSNHNILWDLLYSGRIDAAFTNGLLWRHQIKYLELDPTAVQLSFKTTDFANDLYIAASLTTDKKIVDALASALEQMKADGSYQTILSKWSI